MALDPLSCVVSGSCAVITPAAEVLALGVEAVLALTGWPEELFGWVGAFRFAFI